MHRRNHPPGLFIIGIVAAVCFSGGSLAQEVTDWKARLFAEAPKCWEEYVRFARTLQLSVKWNRYEGANRTPKESGSGELRQTKGAKLAVGYVSEGDSQAEGANPSYSFKLKRRSPERGWIIKGLELPDQSTTFSAEQRKRQEQFFLQLRVCHCLCLESQLWLPTAIHDPVFKITAIKPQEIEGRPVVRFDFDYAKPDNDYPRPGAYHVKGGWMVLDPEHDWILREYVVHQGDPEKGFVHHTFQIREGTDRHPIITRCTIQGVIDKKVIVTTLEQQWEVVEQSDVPLEELTLSAFGLPEPPEIQVERPRWYLWIALTGIVCLGIAATIRRVYRRTGTVG